jgi:hypothetical protein
VRTFEHFVLALFYNACAPHRAVVAAGEVARKSHTLANAVISEPQLDDSRPKPNGFLHRERYSSSRYSAKTLFFHCAPSFAVILSFLPFLECPRISIYQA